jgi:hypothetical protein
MVPCPVGDGDDSALPRKSMESMGINPWKFEEFNKNGN